MILSVGHLLSSIYLVQLKSLSRRSTIFPYTTLFRSDDRENAGAGLRLSTGRDGEDELHAQPRAHHEEAATASAERATDRKSTRLNSSHTVISYAVFCLKKKK